MPLPASSATSGTGVRRSVPSRPDGAGLLLPSPRPLRLPAGSGAPQPTDSGPAVLPYGQPDGHCSPTPIPRAHGIRPNVAPTRPLADSTASETSPTGSPRIEVPVARSSMATRSKSSSMVWYNYIGIDANKTTEPGCTHPNANRMGRSGLKPTRIVYAAARLRATAQTAELVRWPRPRCPTAGHPL